MITQFASLYDLMDAFPDEQSCIDHFTAIRWANGEFCPYCGHDKVYHFADKRTHKCGQCRQRFSIKVGTIFEDTKIPLRKWFMAIWLITSHKKGIASTQIARDIKVTQKTGWFMLHRLRHAARTRSFNRPLKGMVESDESMFGGKDRNKPTWKRGKEEKVVVHGLLERGGELRVKKLDSLKEVRREVIANVEPGTNLMTDEATIYRGMERRFHHHTVNHSADEYSRFGWAHVNGLEGVWSLIKRQIYGIHHWVSAKHLSKYLDEATWRFNRRHVKDGERMNEFLMRLDGRLKYRVLIGKA
jgi:transposase-like protein